MTDFKSPTNQQKLLQLKELLGKKSDVLLNPVDLSQKIQEEQLNSISPEKLSKLNELMSGKIPTVPNLLVEQEQNRVAEQQNLEQINKYLPDMSISRDIPTDQLVQKQNSETINSLLPFGDFSMVPSPSVSEPSRSVASVKPPMENTNPEIQRLKSVISQRSVSPQSPETSPSTVQPEKQDLFTQYQNLLNKLNTDSTDFNKKLADAKEQERDFQLFSRLAEAAGQIGSGFASTGGVGTINSDMSKMKEMRDSFTPYKDVATERALAIEAQKDALDRYFKMAQEQRKSQESDERMKMLGESLKLKQQGLNLSQMRLNELQQYRQDLLDAREKGRISDQQFRNSMEISKIRESFDKKPRVKQIYQEGLGFDAADELMSLAQKGNTVAFSALGTKMARAMGEVGVLTESDVRRYVTSPQLARQIADRANLIFAGKASPETMKEIGIVGKALKAKFEERLQPIMNETAFNVANNLLKGHSNSEQERLKEAYRVLDFPMPSNLNTASKFKTGKVAESAPSLSPEEREVTGQDGKTYIINDKTKSVRLK